VESENFAKLEIGIVERDDLHRQIFLSQWCTQKSGKLGGSSQIPGEANSGEPGFGIGTEWNKTGIEGSCK
jgi:hypothetical protein